MFVVYEFWLGILENGTQNGLSKVPVYAIFLKKYLGTIKNQKREAPVDLPQGRHSRVLMPK